MHAYWAPNVWALYLFLDRVLLAGLKVAGFVGSSEAEGSTTGESRNNNQVSSLDKIIFATRRTIKCGPIRNSVCVRVGSFTRTVACGSAMVIQFLLRPALTFQH